MTAQTEDWRRSWPCELAIAKEGHLPAAAAELHAQCQGIATYDGSNLPDPCFCHCHLEENPNGNPESRPEHDPVAGDPAD